MSLGLAKHTHGLVEGLDRVRLLKVLTADEADGSPLPAGSILLWDDESLEGNCGSIHVANLRDPNVVRPGDVVRLRPNSGQVAVLYRRGSSSNVLFVTERCNSLCLMCSQPPRDDDDSWRIEELLQLVPLIDSSDGQLGITGGEPTLLGNDLVRILRSCRQNLPETELHVLTNGRRFADPALARALIEAGENKVTWAVPLAGDGPERHDNIMGSPGGFRETLLGLAELAENRARVEIRVVLHALSVPRLPELASFIFRRLPFVDHVALMGLEPMGFAKANRDRLWIDPVDYAEELSDAVLYLADRGLSVSIYNLPYCVLPERLWPYARQSISDWKNRFPAECKPCSAKTACAGFFASAGANWRSRGLKPLPDWSLKHEMA